MDYNIHVTVQMSRVGDGWGHTSIPVLSFYCSEVSFPSPGKVWPCKFSSQADQMPEVRYLKQTLCILVTWCLLQRGWGLCFPALKLSRDFGCGCLTRKCGFPVPRGCGLVLFTLPTWNAVVMTLKRHFSPLLVWPQLLKEFLVLASLLRSDSGSVYWRGQNCS